MSNDLKPCKTCGNEDATQVMMQVWVGQGLEERGPYCQCLVCGSMFLAKSRSFEDHCEAWNKRAACQWTSVNDQLPYDGQDVAFIADIPEGRHSYLHGRLLGGSFRGGEFKGFQLPGMTLPASHWMPLPPKPEVAAGPEAAPASGIDG